MGWGRSSCHGRYFAVKNNTILVIPLVSSRLGILYNVYTMQCVNHLIVLNVDENKNLFNFFYLIFFLKRPLSCGVTLSLRGIKILFFE